MDLFVLLAYKFRVYVNCIIDLNFLLKIKQHRLSEEQS